MDTSGVRRILCRLAAAGALLAVTSELAGRLGFGDPDLVALLAHLSVGLNVGALVALALGAVGLALATRSSWWTVAASALGLRTAMACVELLVIDPEAGPPATGLMALAGLTVVAAWGILGLAIFARRRDGPADVGAVAGGVIVLMALAFSGLYLGWSTDAQAPAHQIVMLDLGQALSLIGLPLLAVFMLGAAQGPSANEPARGRTLARGLATGGALLMSVALGAILYAAPIGWMASEATALAGLILGCVGLVLLGWLPGVLRPGPIAWFGAGLVWAASLAIGLAVLLETSQAAAWVAAGLSSLAMVGCGAFLLSAKGAGARPALFAGGLLILGSAVGMTWAALGLSDAHYEVRETLRVLTVMGFLIGFYLAAVALLTGAGPKEAAHRTPRDPGAEGGDA